MSVFSFLKGPDINQGVYEYLRSEGAMLLDVRTPYEYRTGHIPGSRNLPLQSLEDAPELPERKDTPLFVYCHSGVRSRQAVEELRDMGYTNAKNIGGILSYTGKTAFCDKITENAYTV